MIRLLIFIGLIYLLYRVFRLLMLPRNRPARAQGEGTVNAMVQDPSCQTYIPLRDATKKVIHGEVYYFCSKECLEKFEQKK